MHLLYVTDHQIDAYLVKALREAGHVVEVVDRPADALVMAADADYQAILLDWMGPPEDCAARFAAAATWSLVVVIAASRDEAARTRILTAGADAFFPKHAPFIELEARLEALERLVKRVRPAGDAAGVELLPASQAVRLDTRVIGLSGREFRVMAYLIAHAGEVVDLERIQHQVWGDEAEPRPDLVRACLSRLRRKLEAAGAPQWLRAVSGHGYVFQIDPVAAEPYGVGL
jgi:two-component system OmpR family response regulator